MGKKGMGWVPDYPDVRDCTLKHDNVRNIQNSQQTSSGNAVDRAQQFLDLIKILKPSPANPNIPHRLSALEEEFTKEIDSKLRFVSATFTDGFLSLGSTGIAVQDLQNNLAKLHYLKLDNKKNQFVYRNNLLDLDSLNQQSSKAGSQDDQAKDPLGSDAPGFFGKVTEAAVKAFQTNQELDRTGIYTAVTKAELLALISIVGKLGSSKYRSGVSGPGVIYIQALLKAPPDSFEVDELLGFFGTKTSEAVLSFQKEFQNEFLEEKSGKEAIVDQETWEKLIKKYTNEDLRRVLPFAPVPKKRFRELKKYIFRLIKEEEGGISNIIEQLGDWESINRFLFDGSGKKVDSQEPLKPEEIEKRLQKRLEPIVEVLIQLTPCRDKTLPVDNKSLEEALKDSYALLVEIVNQASKSENESTESKRLSRLADWLEQQKGYVSSNIFRYQSYQPGVAQPAIIYIQERLRALGYYDAPTTGYFDEQITQEAVKRFQVARGESEPDGKFKLADIEQLQKMSEERFINLEPPLPDNLTASLIADLGGLEGLIRYFSKTPIFGTIDKIVSSIQDVSKPLNVTQWVEMVQPVIPANALDSSSEAALKKIVQEINESSKTTEEKQALARQFLELLLRFTLHPIAKAIAYLISPIGKYSEPKEAFRDGLRRFRVIAYFSQVQKISRILNGLVVDVSGDIDKLTKEYEPLVETLAILKAEFRQQELSSADLDMVEQLQPLMTSALHKSTLSVVKDISQINQPTQLVEAVKKWIEEQIFVDAERYVTPHGKAQQADTKGNTKHPDSEVFDTTKNSTINIIPRRDQTFIRVDLNCDRCSLQLPVIGKMHRALFQQPALSQSQQAGECDTTYTTYLILPDSVDLSIWCSEVEDQGGLDACTAHAGVALLEYFEKKSFGNALDASSRFLYKVTRNLMHREGDTGASVRETMRAMVLFGVPPEEYCPYDEAKFDDDPSAFCYAFAQNYQTITYFRLDGAGMPARELLAQIKTILVGGFPCMFGFTVYDSIHDKTNPPGHIPYPTLDDKQEGGHAAIVVGYNDYKQIKNATNPGAFLIKNSWGVDWGEGGYGWLPYDYVLNGLARDWWSLIKSEWVESKQFGLSSPDAWTANLGDTITSR